MLGIVTSLLIISLIALCVFIGLYIACAKKKKDSYKSPHIPGTPEYLNCPMCGVCTGMRTETFPDRCLKKMLYNEGIDTEYT